MSVFRDESGVRGHAVRAASVLGAAVAVAALGVFLVSIFPAPWSQSAFEPERAPVSRGVLPAGHPLESKARERVYRNEAARLKTLLTEAQAAQRRRKPADAREPVLAGFAVNWDPQSLVSLQAHADQLTHAMPEWIRIGPDGSFLVEEDARVAQAAARLELTPTVSNYTDGEFKKSLIKPLLDSEKARKDAAQRLARLCEERGFAGVNLDFENLDAQMWQELAALVESAWGELHPRGFLLSVDLPAEPRGVPVERLAAATDFLVVMAYDEHASTDNPGPIATPAYVAASVAAYLKVAPAEKIVAALGAYGYDWPLDAEGDTSRPAEELAFAQALALARENEVAVEWDAQAKSSFFEYDDDEKHEKQEVRFLDAPAMAAQLEALQPLHLRGVAIWRLGAEDPRIFDLFAHAPNPRRFDEQQARQRLDGVITAHDPDDVAQVGE